MKARRRQPGVDDERDPEAPDEFESDARYAKEGPWFPLMMGVVLLAMVGCVMLLGPQSTQHAWLRTSREAAVADAAQAAADAAAAEARRAAAAKTAAYAARPLQQQPGLPDGAEVPAPEAEFGKTTRVRCETTAGPIDVDVFEGWAPLGARRFLDMVESGFFSSRVGLFRSVKNFLCQTGVAGDPAVHKDWRKKGPVKDDPQWLDMKGTKRPLKRGYLSFAGSGPNSRTTEFFFAFRDLQLGGAAWEVPFGRLNGAHSFAAMDRFYAGYGDMAAFGGRAPAQGKIYNRGAAYLDEEFPELDFITSCGAAPSVL